jgi:hypothetical protein
MFGGAFSARGDLLVITDMKSGAHLLDAHTLETQRVLPVAGACAADFSADGELFAIGATKAGVVLRRARASSRAPSAKA